MNYYGFVFGESKVAIESVTAREDGVYSLAKYVIYEESSLKDLCINRVIFIAKSMKRHEVKEAVEAVCNVYNTWCLNQNFPTSESVRFQNRSNWTVTSQSCTIQERGFVYLYRHFQNQDFLKDVLLGISPESLITLTKQLKL
jgi:hypothetical protein